MAAAAGSQRGVSKVNKGFAFDKDTWAVSLLNTGSHFSGHAVIVVEGYKDGNLFVGQYDIQALVSKAETSLVQQSLQNWQGVITEVRAFEGTSYTRNYEGLPGKTWHGTAEKVGNMIEHIKKMKAEVEQDAKQKVYRYKYQAAGSESILPGNGQDNCVTWAEKELKIAEIGNGVKPLDSWKALPAVHAAGGNQSASATADNNESTTGGESGGCTTM